MRLYKKNLHQSRVNAASLCDIKVMELLENTWYRSGWGKKNKTWKLRQGNSDTLKHAEHNAPSKSEPDL